MKEITIFGNLGKDAELRKTPNNQSVCGFTVAVNDKRANETYWFDCSYWGRAGEGVAPWLKKGTPVVLTGELSWREYNGNKYLQINVRSLKMTGRPDVVDEDNQDMEDTSNDAPANDFDDEIPF